MKYLIKKILCMVRIAILLPGLRHSDPRFFEDLKRWKDICCMKEKDKLALAILLWEKQEFRNLFIYRNGHRIFYRTLIKILYPPMQSLFIQAEDIGGGLFIQHGFATMITAKSLGENCWVNQQVTIGYNGMNPPPVIGNNVTITCGAKVLGNIHIGDGAMIGANAVVLKDVEPKAVMVGIPAKRIR